MVNHLRVIFDDPPNMDMVSFRQKTTKKPENRWLEDNSSPFGMAYFQVLSLFREGISLKKARGTPRVPLHPWRDPFRS